MYQLSFQYDYASQHDGFISYDTLEEGLLAYEAELEADKRYGGLLFLELSHEHGVVRSTWSRA